MGVVLKILDLIKPKFIGVCMHCNKYLFICILFIFSFIPILQANNTSSEYLEDLYIKAVKFEEREDFKLAKQLYDDILKYNPSFKDVQNRLYYYKEIIKYKSITMKEPQKAHAHASLGEYYSYKGWFEKALFEINRAISLEPDCSTWYAYLGDAVSEKGDLQNAILAYEKALSIDSAWLNITKVTTLRNLAYNYLAIDDFERSHYYYKKALKLAKKENIKKEEAYIHSMLAGLFSDNNPTNLQYDLSKAEISAIEAINLSEGDLFNEMALAVIYFQRNKTRQAYEMVSNVETKVQKLSDSKAIEKSDVYAYIGYFYAFAKDPSSCAAAMNKSFDFSARQAEYLIRELEYEFKHVSKSPEMKDVIERARAIVQ